MKKIFRFLLKSILAILAIIIIAIITLKIVYTEDVPQGKSGKLADDLALKILDAINHKQFTEVNEIQWTFRGVNKYEWKVQQNLVDVYWGDYRVAYQTQKPQSSFAFKDGKPLKGEEKDEAIAYAAKNFNNDSFWVVAPYKIFDLGTTRELIIEDGKEKLLVTYNSGGTTPGDSYLWEVDDNYRPTSFKMWVSILPLDAIEAKWSDWEITAGDFPLAQKRSILGVTIPVTDLKVNP
ncbi:hypothetical protein [uncultured Nonlabens sp.]|uniref:hypothetical protein n=1 Tax=uncultured Nonlabens sp. TaxID=859306 RepID=UPI00261C9505|nr:hypothetical protein [uncultured Nonlabens sp.]